MYNSAIDGYPKSNRRHKGLEIFKSLSDEIRQVRLDDVRGGDGNLVVLFPIQGAVFAVGT